MEHPIPSTSNLHQDTDSNMCEPSSSSNRDPVASSSQRPETAPKTSKPQSRVGNFQPSAVYLKKLGIKVRDFAFESTLPPVPTYYLQKRQIQPPVNRPLRRESTEPDDGSQQQSQGTQTLERRPTEPVITPEQSVRAKAFNNLEEYDDTAANSQQPGGGHEDTVSSSQAADHLLEIQGATNFLTAPSDAEQGQNLLNRGSNSDNATFTLQGALASQTAGSEPLHHIAQDLRHNNASATSGIFSISFSSSPLTPLSSSPSSSPPNGARVIPLSSQLSNTLHSNPACDIRTPGTSRVLSPSTRYYFRKRPPPPPTTTPSRPSKRIRLFAPPESPLRVARENSSKTKSSSSSSKAKNVKDTKNSKTTEKSNCSGSRSIRGTSSGEVKGNGKRKKH